MNVARGRHDQSTITSICRTFSKQDINSAKCITYVRDRALSASDPDQPSRPVVLSNPGRAQGCLHFKIANQTRAAPTFSPEQRRASQAHLRPGAGSNYCLNAAGVLAGGLRRTLRPPSSFAAPVGQQLAGMGAKTLAPLAVVPAKSVKLGYMMHDEERPLDVEPNVALCHLEKYMAERAALVSAHHHRELAAAQARHRPPSRLQQHCTEPDLLFQPCLPLRVGSKL